jgi:hypothetical protein
MQEPKNSQKTWLTFKEAVDVFSLATTPGNLRKFFEIFGEINTNGLPTFLGLEKGIALRTTTVVTDILGAGTTTQELVIASTYFTPDVILNINGTVDEIVSRYEEFFTPTEEEA